MNWHSMEVWSDVVGVLSAAAMVVPAWKADSLAAFVANFRSTLSQCRPTVGDPNTGQVLVDLEQLAATWRAPDQRLLRAGVLLLALSFLMKMGHHAGLAF